MSIVMGDSNVCSRTRLYFKATVCRFVGPHRALFDPNTAPIDQNRGKSASRSSRYSGSARSQPRIVIGVESHDGVESSKFLSGTAIDRSFPMVSMEVHDLSHSRLEDSGSIPAKGDPKLPSRK
eukprot:547674-Prymnesium_polylepis.1